MNQTPNPPPCWSVRKRLKLTSIYQHFSRRPNGLSSSTQHTKGSVYSELDTSNNQIRLLLVQPSKDADAQIQCHQKQVSLNDNPEFEALSYAWGDPELVKSILVDEREFKVTLGAWSALKALRYDDRVRVLWIDAICINQEDMVERTAQLKLMGMIYRKSNSVRVWIGPSDDDDKVAISTLRTLASGEGIKELLEYWGLCQDKRDLAIRFLETPWWTRLWVVQEVALGQHVVFQKGPEELDFEDLLAAYCNSESFLNEHFRGYINGCYDGGQENFMETFASVKTLGQVRELCGVDFANNDKVLVRESAMTWSTVANLLRNKKVSYDQDRLYALYGLLPSSVIARPGMTPSYTSSVEEVFIDVSYNIMEASQCLMMFNFLGSQSSEKSPGLPSWVPDWTLAPTNRYEANLRVVREHMYNASSGTDFYLRRLSSNTICLKGFFVGVVVTYHPTGLLPTASLILDLIYKSWRETCQNTLPSIRSPIQTFWRTMAWDCAPGDEEGTLKTLDRDELLAMIAAHDRAVRIGEGDEPYVGGQSPEDARRTNYMMNCAKGRVMIITDHFFLGMAQENARVGDHIFIVSGNSHPVILRLSKKYADTWHAVGECYLHDFMYGSAVQNMEIFAEAAKFWDAQPEIQSLKSTERNPRWDEITEQPDGLWKWLLIE